MNWNKELLNDNFLEGKELVTAPTRDAYGAAIVSLGHKDERVVALNADLEGSVRLETFADEFPDRSFQVGVAEQNMASIATGLALYGKIPFFSSFAAFSPSINFSNIRLACWSNANIKIASSHYGLNVGEDGVSAQMLSDISLMRPLPYMKVVTPADINQAFKAVQQTAEINGPVYLRLTRHAFPVVYKEDANFEIGKVKCIA